MRKYSSADMACVRYALRLRRIPRAIPYALVLRGGGYHIVTKIGSLYKDKFGLRKLDDIIADFGKGKKVTVLKTNFDLLKLMVLNPLYQPMRPSEWREDR